MCKHIRALAALGLLKAPKDKPAPSAARGRKAHAKNARAAVAEANALPKEVRRHLAAMGPAREIEPAGPAREIHGADRRAIAAGLPHSGTLDIDILNMPSLPEGWQLGGAALKPAPAPKELPPAPAGSFAAGFRRAIADHLALKRGELMECAACRYPFDPETEGSAPLSLCGPCLLEEKGGRS
jgi:hypothetical protein